MDLKSILENDPLTINFEYNGTHYILINKKVSFYILSICQHSQKALLKFDLYKKIQTRNTENKLPGKNRVILLSKF